MAEHHNESIELSSAVAALSAAVVHDDEGRFYFEDEKLHAFAPAIVDVPLTQKRRHADELLATIIKFERLDAARTRPACIQMAALLSLLFGDLVQAQQAIEGAGSKLGADDLKAVGVQASSLRPVVHQPGGLSPMDVRLGIKK